MTWKNIITQQLDAIQPLFVAGAFVVASLFYFLFSKDSLSKVSLIKIMNLINFPFRAKSATSFRALLLFWHLDCFF